MVFFRNLPILIKILFSLQHYLLKNLQLCNYPTNPRFSQAFIISSLFTLKFQKCFLILQKFNFCLSKNKFMVFCILHSFFSPNLTCFLLFSQTNSSVYITKSFRALHSLFYIIKPSLHIKHITISLYLQSISCVLLFSRHIICNKY